jgi:two-component system response regulator QseB
MRILIVEDDPLLLDGLAIGLGLKGFTVDAVANCEDGRIAVGMHSYDCIVLDVMLPDGSGLDLLKELRAAKNCTPVLLLTARDQVPERIAGLDAGGDDYVGKPFDLDELAARLRALARRGAGRATAYLEWRGVVLDPAALRATKDGVSLKLTRREFAVLRALMERPTAIVSKAALEEALYGWQEEIESNAVEVHVHHLRAKLGQDFIKTVRGLGYRLAEEGA